MGASPSGHLGAREGALEFLKAESENRWIGGSVGPSGCVHV